MIKKYLMPDLFENKEENAWQTEWHDMPEFKMEDLSSFRKIVIHFRSNADVIAFAELIGQKITDKQKALWFPEWQKRRYANKRYVDDES